MGKFYKRLNEKHQTFIGEQKIFFTATAPAEGRINLSPKGMDTFRCLEGGQQVAYLDLTGSGNETAAHLSENERITVMFCSFSAQPLILRIYGRGRIVRPADAEWASLRPHFPALAGARQIVLLEVESVQTSCGFAVPVYELKEERRKLVEWTQKRGEDGVRDYHQKMNQVSIDGRPVYTKS